MNSKYKTYTLKASVFILAKSLLGVLLLCSLHSNATAEESECGNKLGSFWSKYTTNQCLSRAAKAYYIGANFQGVVAGYHYNKKTTFEIAYTPENFFTKEGEFEVGGVREGLGSFENGSSENYAGLTGEAADYENSDKHLTRFLTRYHLIGPLSLVGGLGIAFDSTRKIKFAKAKHTLGNNTYDTAVNASWTLKDSFSPLVGFDIGHIFRVNWGAIEGIRLAFKGVYGVIPRRVTSVSVETPNATVSSSDLELFKKELINAAEREYYGFYTFDIEIMW